MSELVLQIILNEEFEYFEFQSFGRNIIMRYSPYKDEIKCERNSDILHDIYMNKNRAVLYDLYNTYK